jgi:hypothetical protein
MPEMSTGEARCRPAKGSTNDRKRIGPAERLEKPGALASVEEELAKEPAHRINPSCTPSRGTILVVAPISHDLSISRLAISAAGWALHAIAPAALGTIERLIAGFEERSNCQRAHPWLVRGHADTC